MCALAKIMRCTVIGAGVSGLSCAIRLLESGHQVEVVSDKFSPDTVSDVAAAIWYPFLAAPVDKADRWGLETYSELERFAKEVKLKILHWTHMRSTHQNKRDTKASFLW